MAPRHLVHPLLFVITSRFRIAELLQPSPAVCHGLGSNRASDEAGKAACGTGAQQADNLLSGCLAHSAVFVAFGPVSSGNDWPPGCTRQAMAVVPRRRQPGTGWRQ